MALSWSIQKKWDPTPLPPPTGRWAEWLVAQRAQGCPPGDQLRGIEAQGATAEELADLAMEMFLPLFPRFLGLSRGLQKQEDLSPLDVEMNLWVLQTLEDGWRVLEIFGTDPLDLLAWVLGHRPSSGWMDDLGKLRVPAQFLEVLRPNGLLFHAQQAPLDIRWLTRVAGELILLGPIPHALLAEKVRSHSEVWLREVGGVRALKDWEASALHVVRCPDLVEILVHPRTPTYVQGCLSLKSIRGDLQSKLVIEDCPDLELLDVVFPRSGPPTPSLTVRRCPRLQVIGRVSPHHMECLDLILEDCPSLATFRPKLTIRRERLIDGCPGLQVQP